MVRYAAWTVTALLVAVLAVPFTGASAQQPVTIRVAIQADPTTLDPALTDDPTGTALLQDVYSPLMDLDSNGRLKLLAAKSWSVSPDGKTFHFALRDGLKFQNGRPVTATDVKYTLDRLADPKVDSPNADLLVAPIAGYAEEQAKKAPGLSGVKVVDASRIDITVDPTQGDILVRLAHVATGIVSRESVEQGGENWGTTHANGTGPYTIAQWSLRNQIVLAANPGYFEGAPKIQRIVLQIVPDPTTDVAKYEAGELDITQVPGTDYSRLKRDATLSREVVEYNRAATVFMALNQFAYAPFKDVRVRRAVAYAINRPVLVKAIFAGLFTPATGILPPQVPGYHALTPIPYDPPKARAMLAEAGYPQGRGLPPLVLGPNPRGYGPSQAAQAVAAMIHQTLGIETRVQLLDIAKWRSDLKSKTAFSAVTGWTADIADPNDYLYALFVSNGPFIHFSGYNSPAYDKMVAAANRQSTREGMLKQMGGVEKYLIVDDAGVIPIYYVREALLIKPYVHNMTFTAYGLGFIEHLNTASIVK
ncbi:MAG TPA: ABC transporter substrate-binding protein [bacterium]|nr:ABC transporter substrate-binding protein [bacterium]